MSFLPEVCQDFVDDRSITVAFRGAPRHHPFDDPDEAAWSLGANLSQRGALAPIGLRTSAGQQEVGQTAQGVDIAARGGLVPLKLLGSGERAEGAQDLSVLLRGDIGLIAADARVRRVLDAIAERAAAQPHHFDPVFFVAQHVFWSEIAVDGSLVVEVADGSGDLEENVDGGSGGKWALIGHFLSKMLCGRVFHH